MLRIVPHVGPCHIFHHIILRKASGAQCAPYEDLFDNLKFSYFFQKYLLPLQNAGSIFRISIQKRFQQRKRAGR